LVAAAKFSVEATKKSFVVPNFVAVTKPFFPCYLFFLEILKQKDMWAFKMLRMHYK